MRLEGKVAIVTGAGAGIGEAIAHKLALEGAAVLVADLPNSAAGEVAADIVKAGGRAVCHLADLSEEDGTEACVQAAVDAFGRLDILASNAGVFTHQDEVDTCSLNTFDYMMRNNTRPTFLMTKAALPTSGARKATSSTLARSSRWSAHPNWPFTGAARGSCTPS